MGNNWTMIAGFVILGLISITNAQYGKPCEGYDQSEIYCYGDFLLTVQMAKLYKDQKVFVDRPLKSDPEVVLQEFEKLNITGNTNLTETERGELEKFIDEHFERNGTEFQDWDPVDWVENPSFLEDIENEHLRNWGEELHSFWKELGRQIKPEVRDNPNKQSMYFVSHPVIVPGGRFKEFYYWDSYWIQRGLLVSNMTTTVNGMIQNFLEIVEKLGFIPNGGRIYYQRSQPPLLIPMMDSYFEATGDLEFVRTSLPLLIQEYNWFLANRTIDFRLNGKQYKMARYNVELTDPRPESFSQDYELVEPLNITNSEKDDLYANLKTGAESGWDFSSRWYVLPEGESLIDGTLENTKTREIIPVDLNSFMYWNAALLSKFCDLLNDARAEYFHNEALRWKDSIHEVLWDEEAGTWFDFDFIRLQKRKHFYPTNLTPLWVRAVHGDIRVAGRRSANYLRLSGATNFPGGIPTSMLHTGLQWDFPNGWPPLNHLVVEALEKSNESSAQSLAYELAEKWIQTNHLAYLRDTHMFEKYDVSCLGCAGGGGEYEVVVGFGWTNGVVLDFLKKYGNRLAPTTAIPTPSPIGSSTPETTESSANVVGKSFWVVLSSLIAIVLKVLVQ